MELEQEIATVVQEIRDRASTRKFLKYAEVVEPGSPGTTPTQAKFHSLRSLGRIIIAGNRAGKTTAGAMEAAMWCLSTYVNSSGSRVNWFGRPVPSLPVYGRVVCPELPGSLDDPHIQRDMFRELVPPSLLRGESFNRAWSAMGHALYFANGSWIEFMSFEQDLDKHAGASRNFVWFDEECPQDVFYENLARLDKELGAWWMTYTPVVGLQWIYEDLYVPAQNKQKGMEVLEMSTYENRGNLRDGYIKEMLETLPEDEVKRRLEGKYTTNRGLVYDIFGHEHFVKLEAIPDEAGNRN